MSSFQQIPNMPPLRGAVAAPVSFIDILRFSLAVVLMSLLVNASIPQMEMAIFGGSIPISVAFPELYMIVCLIFFALIKPQFTPSSLVAPTFILAVFLVVDAASLAFLEELSGKEIFFTFLTYFMMLILAALVSTFSVEIGEQTFITLILFSFWVNFAIALLQHITNTPILSTSSNDQTYVTPAVIFQGGLQRAFGLFNNGMDLGLFSSLVAALGVRFCRGIWGTLHGILIIAAAAFICYCTYTRLTFIGVICCICSTYVLSHRYWRRLGVFLPLLWLVVGLGVAFQALNSNVTKTSLSSTDSMNSRYAGWIEAYSAFSSSNLWEKFWGIGMVPNPGRNVSSPLSKVANYPIDNAFFILLIYIGVIGIIVAAYFLIRAWLYIYRVAMEEDTDLRCALAAFWSTFLITGLFNWAIDLFGLTLLMFVMLRRKQETPALAGN